MQPHTLACLAPSRCCHATPTTCCCLCCRPTHPRPRPAVTTPRTPAPTPHPPPDPRPRGPQAGQTERHDVRVRRHICGGARPDREPPGGAGLGQPQGAAQGEGGGGGVGGGRWVVGGDQGHDAATPQSLGLPSTHACTRPQHVLLPLPDTTHTRCPVRIVFLVLFNTHARPAAAVCLCRPTRWPPTWRVLCLSP